MVRSPERRGHAIGTVVDAFVPQMLNYESLGGVNFKKGCYPGQEVVARSQFRGTLKRRAYLVHAEQALSVGQEVFSAEDLEQATGTVVQAAAAVQGGWDAIVSMQIASSTATICLPMRRWPKARAPMRARALRCRSCPCPTSCWRISEPLGPGIACPATATTSAHEQLAPDYRHRWLLALAWGCCAP
jgi:folate-binding protein YgfZ